MSKPYSTRPQKPKPDRPEGSPIFWHPSGRWCKKILGRQHYFGRGTHDEALAEYERQKAELHSGRKPQDEPEALTVFLLCAKFLKAKKAARDGGELAPRSFLDYADLCKRLIRVLGKTRLVADLRPDDFGRLRADMAKTWGPVRLAAEIVRTRTPFNWAFKSMLIDRPVNYGDSFKRPSAKVLRQAKAAKGLRMFEAHEIRRMLDATAQPLRTMILLGINCGYSNSDIGSLPLSALDLEHGWITYARVKTGVMRKTPLWVETTAAIRDWLAIRPKPKDNKHSALVFITSKGQPWGKDIADNPVSKEMRRLLDRLGIDGGRTYYHLRHGLQTIGDETSDFVAVRHLMGHAFSGDISSVYRERVSDDRLRKVVNHLHSWLFDDPSGEGEVPDVLPLVKSNVG